MADDSPPTYSPDHFPSSAEEDPVQIAKKIGKVTTTSFEIIRATLIVIVLLQFLCCIKTESAGWILSSSLVSGQTLSGQILISELEDSAVAVA